MKYENVTDNLIVHRLTRLCEIQFILTEFHNSPNRAWKLTFMHHEYRDPREAQSICNETVRSLGYPVKACILDGQLYLVKYHKPENT